MCLNESLYSLTVHTASIQLKVLEHYSDVIRNDVKMSLFICEEKNIKKVCKYLENALNAMQSSSSVVEVHHDRDFNYALVTMLET